MRLPKVRFYAMVTGVSLAALGTWLVVPMPAQEGVSGDWWSYTRSSPSPRISPSLDASVHESCTRHSFQIIQKIAR